MSQSLLLLAFRLSLAGSAGQEPSKAEGHALLHRFISRNPHGLLLIVSQYLLKDLGKLWEGAGAGSGTVSAPSSRAKKFEGEEALRGSSLKEAGRLAEDEWEVATMVVFLLLKAGPSTESSSSSELMSTTPLFFSRGLEEEKPLL